MRVLANPRDVAEHALRFERRLARIHARLDERLAPELDVRVDLFAKLGVQPAAEQEGPCAPQECQQGTPRSLHPQRDERIDAGRPAGGHEGRSGRDRRQHE